MAKIFLECTANEADQPYSRRDYYRLIHYATKDKFQNHILVDNPEIADIIIFIGSSSVNYSDIRKSNTYKQFKKKSLIFFSGDKCIPLIPGIYTSLQRRWFYKNHLNNKIISSGFYIRVSENTSVDIKESINSAKYLFSFVGNSHNHPVRKRICDLRYEDSFIRDSSNDIVKQADGLHGNNKERGMLYRDIIAQSKFILCPRGIGISSWRIFETMRAGRVPVIIADGWIPPEGPDWKSFAVFIDEKDISSIHESLKAIEHLAESLGAKSRQEWDKWYAEDVVFNTVINMALSVNLQSSFLDKILNITVMAQYFELFYFRHWLLSPFKNQYKSIIKYISQNQQKY